jgi:hypothetical protein
MKKIFVLAALLSASLFQYPSMASAGGVAATSQVPAPSLQLPIEVSALILSPQFTAEVQKQSVIATRSGKTLRVVGFSAQSYGSATYVYATLSAKISAEFQGAWQYAGTVIGVINYGPMGEPSVRGVYLKPVESPPGGASVGNH